MERSGYFDGAIRSSASFKAAMRFDQVSEVAFERSLTGRFFNAIARVICASWIIQTLASATHLRTICASSYLAKISRALGAAVGFPLRKAVGAWSATFPGWRTIWMNSRVSDYWHFIFNYKTGVALLVAFMPIKLYALDFLPSAAKYADLFLLALMVGALLISALAGKRKLRWTELELPIAVYAAVAFFSSMYNGVPLMIAFMGTMIILLFYLFYFIIVQAEFDREWLKKLVLGIIGFAVILSLFGLTQMFTGIKLPETTDIHETTITGRIVSTFANPNNFGGFLLLVMPGAIALLISKTKPSIRFFAGASTIVMLAALILTYSRSAWFGLAVSFVILAALLDKRLMPGLAVAGLGVLALAPNIIDRVAFGLSDKYMATSQLGGRLLYWGKALEILKMSPLLGAGPGRFGGAVAAVYGTPVNSLVGFAPNYQVWVDSQFFQILAEVGVLGLIASLWIALAFVKNAIAFFNREEDPFWRAYAVGAVGSVVGVLVEGLFVGVWETRQISAFFWLCMAIVMSLAIRKSRPERDPS